MFEVWIYDQFGVLLAIGEVTSWESLMADTWTFHDTDSIRIRPMGTMQEQYGPVIEWHD